MQLDDLTVEQRIQRLKRNLDLFLASPEFRNLDAYVRKQTLNPPLSIKVIAEVEREKKVSFPEDYKLFLTKVSNGGLGPHLGLLSFEGSLKMAQMCNVQEPFQLISLFNGDDWVVCESSSNKPVDVENYLFGGTEDDFEYKSKYGDSSPFYPQFDGAWIIAEQGCGYSSLLVVNGQEHGKVWNDFTAADCGVVPQVSGSGKSLTFTEWYESWLIWTMQKANLDFQFA